MFPGIRTCCKVETKPLSESNWIRARDHRCTRIWTYCYHHNTCKSLECRSHISCILYLKEFLEWSSLDKNEFLPICTISSGTFPVHQSYHNRISSRHHSTHFQNISHSFLLSWHRNPGHHIFKCQTHCIPHRHKYHTANTSLTKLWC